MIVGFGVTPEYRELNGAKNWLPDGPANQLGHAMVVIGYNDYDQTFELMNSFGINWGNNGFIKIGYQAFSKYARHAYILNVVTSKKSTELSLEEVVAMRLNLSVQTSQQNDRTRFKAIPVKAKAQDGTYLLESPNAERGSGLVRFKVDLQAGRHLYLINLDPTNHSQLLFHLEDLPKDTTVVFPGRGGLRLSRSGTEQIAAILTYRPIHDIDQLVQALVKEDGDIKIRIERIFKPYIVPKEKVIYQKDGMQLESRVKYSDGIAVPLFIKIQSP